MSGAIIEIDGVAKRFVKELDLAERTAGLLGAKVQRQVVHAVDGVDLSIQRGEVVGLVGESGCGKSTLGRIVAGLLPPTEGKVRFNGREVAGLSGKDARDAALQVQMIFQDPMSSLNPRHRVAEIIGEAPRYHNIVPRRDIPAYVAEMLDRVGLEAGYERRYPHQFSGGQRQRICIARALAVRPDFLVCDESVAALDVSIQAQVLNLFISLREEFRLTYLFISHDLGVVEHISDRVAIMYLGRIVERGPTEEIFTTPNHPYTRALLDEVPRVHPGKRVYNAIEGEIPSPLAPPPGCHFHPRCPHAMPRCRNEAPALKEVAPGRLSACHLNDQS